VTYPHPEVERVLALEFIPVRINVDDRTDIARQFSLMWSPALLALDHRRFLLRQTAGYLPPAEILAELRFVKGLFELRHSRPLRAMEAFMQVERDYPNAGLVPEAIYWQGIAAYRISKNKEDLWVVWRRLVTEYPDTLWAAKTTLLE
jgi:hypothetical protein